MYVRRGGDRLGTASGPMLVPPLPYRIHDDRTAHSRPPCRRWPKPGRAPMREKPMVGRFVLAEANHHRAPLGHGQRAQMRPRHAARVQRPYGQIPKAIRPDTDGHTAESPRTRSRIEPRTRSRSHGCRECEPLRASSRQPNRLSDPQRSESDRRPAEART